ncbi:MAG: hypothetical protein AAF871_07340 [Pseudomonadota bacterium]
MNRALIAHLGLSDLNEEEVRLVHFYRYWLEHNGSSKPGENAISRKFERAYFAAALKQMFSIFKEAALVRPDFRGEFEARTIKEEFVLDRVRPSTRIDRLGGDPAQYGRKELAS